MVSITAEMLHVSLIALGEIPLAVVNGTRLAEGDLISLQTPSGMVTLRVEKIQDGVVHLKCVRRWSPPS